MRINSFRTKSDAEVELGDFTVLVGPNNVGKSQTLRDIHKTITSGRRQPNVILEDVDVELPDRFDDLFAGLQVIDDPNNVDRQIVRGIQSELTTGGDVRFVHDSLEQQFERDQYDNILASLGKFRVAFLDAASRLNVAQRSGSFNPHTSGPTTLMQGLFARADTVEPRLRAAFRSTFGLDIRLDYSGMTQLELRVAHEFDEIPEHPVEAYPVMQRYKRLDEQGDGFRSFVGVVLSVLLSEGRIILLDEPEAFLHPAQARSLGRWIAENAAGSGGQIVVATHNSSFLAGILGAGEDTDVYRLNRSEDVTSYHHIPGPVTTRLATSPLLSSQRVLESVFFKGVVVCEADSDRSVYQSVASQALDEDEFLFVHAHNKQTVKDIVEVLIATSIPVAAIVDFDMIHTEAELQQLVEAFDADFREAMREARTTIVEAIEAEPDAAVLTELERQVIEFSEQLQRGEHTLSGARGALSRIRRQSSNWRAVKDDGLGALEDGSRAAAVNLLDELGEHGIFLVPVGELEGWMDLGTRRKSTWVVEALERIHGNRCAGELAEFVGQVIEFLGDSGA